MKLEKKGNGKSHNSHDNLIITSPLISYLSDVKHGAKTPAKIQLASIQNLSILLFQYPERFSIPTTRDIIHIFTDINHRALAKDGIHYLTVWNGCSMTFL